MRLELDGEQRKAAQLAVDSGLLAAVLNAMEEQAFIAWADARDGRDHNTVRALQLAYDERCAAERVANLIRMGAGING